MKLSGVPKKYRDRIKAMFKDVPLGQQVNDMVQQSLDDAATWDEARDMINSDCDDTINVARKVQLHLCGKD